MIQPQQNSRTPGDRGNKDKQPERSVAAKHDPSARAFALPAPDLVLFKLIVPSVYYLEECLSTDTCVDPTTYTLIKTSLCYDWWAPLRRLYVSDTHLIGDGHLSHNTEIVTCALPAAVVGIDVLTIKSCAHDDDGPRAQELPLPLLPRRRRLRCPTSPRSASSPRPRPKLTSKLTDPLMRASASKTSQRLSLASVTRHFLV
jgi:hypothetical protein